MFEILFNRKLNYSQSQRKCSGQHNYESSRPNRETTIPREIKFNSPTLPKHIDENTIFGVPTSDKLSILDVVYGNRSASTKFNDYADDETVYYKNYNSCYRSNKIEKQFNRKYTKSFDPDYRYGKTIKRFPAGVWFKYIVEPKPSNNTDCVPKIWERCANVESNKQKPNLRAEHIINGSEPDKKYCDRIQVLAAINKIKHTVKKGEYDLKNMRETYKFLDEESTGWLPLEQVYEVCYQHDIIPDKKLFVNALNSVQAIDNDRVRYDLFTDLLDSNVKYSVDFNFTNDNREKCQERNITTYNNDYENRSHQIVRLNKITNYTSKLLHAPVKSATVVEQDHFGSETDVKTLLSPTIYTNHGLSFRDFHIGRDKEEMQKLFHNAGMNLSNDAFNVIWDNASKQCDNNDGEVNIEDFRQALRAFQAGMIDRKM